MIRDRSRADAAGEQVPRPLRVAAALVVVEAVLLLASAVAELLSLSSSRLALGVSTTVFFALYAGGLLLGAWGLTRLSTWSRAPIVLAQLIQLGVAWSFRGGATTLVTLGLAALAAAVLVGVLHPASTAALVDDPTGDRRDED